MPGSRNAGLARRSTGGCRSGRRPPTRDRAAGPPRPGRVACATIGRPSPRSVKGPAPMVAPEVERVPEGLKRRWPDIRPEDREAVAAVLERDILGGVGAPEMTALEREWAAFVGRDSCLLFNSGTAAIHSALYALGIGPGEEVITTAYTFAGTWQPILQ